MTGRSGPDLNRSLRLMKITIFGQSFEYDNDRLKFEIQKAIDSVPDSVLVDILDYLKQIQKTPSENIDLSRHLGLMEINALDRF